MTDRDYSATMAALMTEQRNPQSQKIDTLAISQIIDLINDEDKTVAEAVRKAKEDIARGVELIVEAFQKGGRLFYVGAGTSGRLGVLDAAECPPTFSAPPEMVQGIIAGGYDALVRSVEGAEDDRSGGAKALKERGFGRDDVVVGITSSSTTQFVVGALDYAKEVGARTIFIACSRRDDLPLTPDVVITLLVGPEVITGSTRMKAGTATKMILNMLTTTAMIRLGKVYSNLMVDLKTSSKKLLDRGCRIIVTLTGVEYDEARELLERAGNSVKVALVMQKRTVGREEAERLLKEHDGFVGRVVETV